MNAHRGEMAIELADGSHLKLKATWDAIGHLQTDIGVAEFFAVPGAILEIVEGKRNASIVTDYIFRLAQAAGEPLATREDAAQLTFARSFEAIPVIIETFKRGGFLTVPEFGDDAGNVASPNRNARRAKAATAKTN